MGLGKTEWEDIQIKYGNMEAPPKQLTEDELFDLIKEAAEMATEAEKNEKLENASLKDLKDMEDDEDEDVLEQLRKKRIQQMKVEAELNKFGELKEISEPSYKSEVTECKGVMVVVHLFKNGYDLIILYIFKTYLKYMYISNYNYFYNYNIIKYSSMSISKSTFNNISKEI